MQHSQQAIQTGGMPQVNEGDIRLDKSRPKSQHGGKPYMNGADYGAMNSFMLEKYLSTLATKEEVAKLRGDMEAGFEKFRADIAELRGEMRGEIGELRGEIKSLRTETHMIKTELHLAIYRTAGAIIVSIFVAAGGLATFMKYFL